MLQICYKLIQILWDICDDNDSHKNIIFFVPVVAVFAASYIQYVLKFLFSSVIVKSKLPSSFLFNRCQTNTVAQTVSWDTKWQLQFYTHLYWLQSSE